jgi:hypothetical protein
MLVNKISKWDGRIEVIGIGQAAAELLSSGAWVHQTTEDIIQQLEETGEMWTPFHIYRIQKGEE